MACLVIYCVSWPIVMKLTEFSQSSVSQGEQRDNHCLPFERLFDGCIVQDSKQAVPLLLPTMTNDPNLSFLKKKPDHVLAILWQCPLKICSCDCQCFSLLLSPLCSRMSQSDLWSSTVVWRRGSIVPAFSATGENKIITRRTILLIESINLASQK